MNEPPLAHDGIEAQLTETVAAIRRRSTLTPSIALTLGSGLGTVAEALENRVALDTALLPHWPRSTVPGHAGRLLLGDWQGTPIAVVSGRTHRYEGYSLFRVTYPVRLLERLGARTFLFTNSAGSLRRELEPGDLMLVRDHLNFLGKRGLFTREELAERRVGARPASCYSPRLAERLLAAARRAGVVLRQGVLLAGHGPAYETPAEIRAARRLGADAICMSTIPEALVAAGLGAEVGCVSCITNRAAGLANRPLSHDEVTRMAERVAGSLRAVLDRLLAPRDAMPQPP